MKIKINENVLHNGVQYKAGMTVDLPNDVAESLKKRGLAKSVRGGKGATASQGNQTAPANSTAQERE